MSYSLATLWYERSRFLPGMLAVAFSALLIALQCGLLLGLFSITSIPIDHTDADIWIGNPDVLSVDLGRPIPEEWLARIAGQPEVARSEIFLQGFAYWGKPTGGTELCCLIGSRLDGNSLGALHELTPELRRRLTEPGAVVVDEAEFERLGISHVGQVAEVTGRRVRIVGVVHGIKSLAGPYVFASIETARPLLRLQRDPPQTMYLLARCRPGVDKNALVERLGHYSNMSTFTTDSFSLRTRMHWLTKTKAGIALGCAAVLGLLVGAVVTSQTLYAATVASLREYAVLRALGIPRWRIAASVVTQSFWVGVIGVAIAFPATLGLKEVAEFFGSQVLLPTWLLVGAGAVTMVMALLSGLAALRSLRLIEPAALLR